MSDSIIQVTNLSKSYTISHEPVPIKSGGRERYTALRDVMAQHKRNVMLRHEACPTGHPGGHLGFCHADPDSYREKPVRLAIQAGISTKLLNITCQTQ